MCASWSVNVLLNGETPTTRWELPPASGVNPLAGQYRAALVQVRGDWAFYAKVFQIPNWNAGPRMCWLCRASDTDPGLPWTDCRTSAAWRDTLWCDEDYRRYLIDSGMAIPVHLLLAIGLRLECLMGDVLHAVDQGYSPHVIGNTV